MTPPALPPGTASVTTSGAEPPAWPRSGAGSAAPSHDRQDRPWRRERRRRVADASQLSLNVSGCGVLPSLFGRVSRPLNVNGPWGMDEAVVASQPCLPDEGRLMIR